mmetsp:Transcript_69630/g.151506  ORF Transcript_69630/g.151506 Transcript_69630/m.151506 type:complete len:251 (+) Transcript_69630:374-1126(+)
MLARKAGVPSIWSNRNAFATHDIGKEEIDELPELPGVPLDGPCIEKLQELEPLERDELIEELRAKMDEGSLRNPSGWLFSKARSKVVARVTGGRGGVPSTWKNDQEDEEKAEIFSSLEEHGIDEDAASKLNELTAHDLRTLCARFDEVNETSGISDPSKWFFAKARSMLAQEAQNRRALRGQVPNLDHLKLDAQAMDKLAELNEEERKQVVADFYTENGRDPIRNPSSWIYGKARTKICNRKRGLRASPY